jgi:hypothetical protein
MAGVVRVAALGPLDCSPAAAGDGCLGLSTARRDRDLLRRAAAAGGGAGGEGCRGVAVVERATAARFGDRGPVTGYRRRATGRLFLRDPLFAACAAAGPRAAPRAGAGEGEAEWEGAEEGRWAEEAAAAIVLINGTCGDWSRLVRPPPPPAGIDSGPGAERAERARAQAGCEGGGAAGRRALFARFARDRVCRAGGFGPAARLADVPPPGVALAAALRALAAPSTPPAGAAGGGVEVRAGAEGEGAAGPGAVGWGGWRTCAQLAEEAGAAERAAAAEVAAERATARARSEAEAAAARARAAAQ